MLSGKTVFVTGGSGFIGGRLVERLMLEQSAHVRVLVRNFSTAARLARFPVEFVFGDMTDASLIASATESCDVVFHCAHQTGLSRKRHREVAVEAVRNLSDAVLGSGVRRLVHLSSFAVYGPTPDGDLTESSAWGSTDNTYILAKREAERELLRLNKRKGVPAVVLQPTIVYGPFCKPWTLRPVEDLKTNRVALVRGGSGYCNAVYIDDVVDAMFRAATQPDVEGETFLVSGDEPITWKAYWDAFAAALGVEGTVEVSDDEFESIVNRQNHRKGTAAQLLALARDPRAASAIKRMFPTLAAGVRFLKRHIPEERVESFKARLYENGSVAGGNGGAKKPLLVPKQALPELYRSRTRVRIDKARALLGYMPRFGFERGMGLTARYLRWAGVV